ncbi:hypothetical protein OHA72_22550 [Dactylosporangium sp. NBC_01737]|uniref:hypothetical protein n=1 Tax=Dactylosporangium sp. NBC_01737 TaxID=2975959 RepID=UPI002E12EE08|nr:hypothetical protein OHA72_22550 [Dactylosporangium sp. NBC_01737]
MEGVSDVVAQELAAPRRGRAPATLPAELEAVHARYVEQLHRVPLSDESKCRSSSTARVARH